MLIQKGQAHLSYCTNVHPSESWAEVEACLRKEVSAVKERVSPDADFGVGLRLSARAARELLEAGELSRLKSLLSSSGLYVFSINGFPYGPFHGEPVKAKVYEPNWSKPERARYTDDLRTIMGELLKEGQVGSISTAPGGYRSLLPSEQEKETVARAWLTEARKLQRQEEETGKTIVLAIEPEPSCLLETTAELVDFFERYLLKKSAIEGLSSESGLSSAQAENAIRRHLGICLDTCHAAVEFEEPDQSLKLLSDAGITIGKIQLSSGLRIPLFDEESGQALEKFNDEVYLHQTVIRKESNLTRFTDLPLALQSEAAQLGSEWRVHFHVPIFRARFGNFHGTQEFLQAVLKRQAEEPLCSHLEVETYTWDVLPPEYQGTSLAESVSRELSWVLERLSP